MVSVPRQDSGRLNFTPVTNYRPLRNLLISKSVVILARDNLASKQTTTIAAQP